MSDFRRLFRFAGLCRPVAGSTKSGPSVLRI